MKTPLFALVTLVSVPCSVLAQSNQLAVSVDNAWARATAASAKTGAVYFTIVDRGAPDELLAASTPAAEKAELHQTIQEGAVMKMRPVGALPVAQDKPLTFAPGGYHVMLINLKHPLLVGQRFPLTLTFQNAGPIQTSVLVKGAGAGGSMQMGGPGHDMDMPMGDPPKR
jgi:copper(I)-binding protein